MNLYDELKSTTLEVEQTICEEMYECLIKNLLEKWYPQVIDQEFGGYFSNIDSNFNLLPSQEKMIVTQARHIWTTAKVAEFLNDNNYIKYSMHGFSFLLSKMWDQKYGGFYQIRDRHGKYSEVEGWRDEKRMYGNAFAIFGLSTLYNVTKNPEVFDLIKKTYNWLERNSFDPIQQGYFQFLKREGIPFGIGDDYNTIASDKSEVGYKDQNSSIHLLEAYTELYGIWNHDHLHKQLLGLLNLIRDIIVHPKGYLRLFFEEDWTPISFRDSPKEIREANYGLDHVSFGHDYETAFLMLEASFALGLVNDVETLKTAKRMLDHAIEFGWDKRMGGFYDEGYYFSQNGDCEIIKDTKNWWAQAEGLNSLLLFSKIFPKDKKYFELFIRQWEYIKKYLIDYEHGDWYWSSLEKEPHFINEPKGNIWKATYHNGRALMNCIKILSDNDSHPVTNNKKFLSLKNHSLDFIEHWRSTAKMNNLF